MVNRGPGSGFGYGFTPSFETDERDVRLDFMEKAIAQVKSLPMQIGIVARQAVGDGHKTYVTVSCAQGLLDFEKRTVEEFDIGDPVWLVTTPQNGIGLFMKAPRSKVPRGMLSSVLQVLAPDMVEVESTPLGARTVYVDPKLAVKLRPGAKVIIEPNGHVIVHALDTHAITSEYVFDGDTRVQWSDIAGLTEAKRVLREVVELSQAHAGLFRAYGKDPIRGVLLAGPPGCGKTMLAKATATALRDTYGKDAKGGFFYLKGPSIIDKYAGVAEAKLRGIFAAARAHVKETSTPAVIFIDEADAIFSERGDPVHTYIERKMVPQALAEMDGLDESNVMVLLATNRPDQLDPAITRNGRISRTVYVTRPDASITEEILGLALAKTMTKDDAKVLASRTAVEAFTDEKVVREYHSPNGSITVRLRDLIDGAMIVGFVEKAVSKAMHRDIDDRRKTPTGIVLADMLEALNDTIVEERQKNHTQVLYEMSTKRIDNPS